MAVESESSGVHVPLHVCKPYDSHSRGIAKGSQSLGKFSRYAWLFQKQRSHVNCEWDAAAVLIWALLGTLGEFIVTQIYVKWVPFRRRYSYLKYIPEPWHPTVKYTFHVRLDTVLKQQNNKSLFCFRLMIWSYNIKHLLLVSVNVVKFNSNRGLSSYRTQYMGG